MAASASSSTSSVFSPIESTTARVREVISHFDYQQLIRDCIIPNMPQYLSTYPSATAVKRYSPFVYAMEKETKQGYSYFGVFMDYLVRAGLRLRLQQPVHLGADPMASSVDRLPEHRMMEVMQWLSIYETSSNLNDIARSANLLTSAFMGIPAYPQATVDKYVSTYSNIMKDLLVKWNHFGAYLNAPVQFNVEMKYSHLVGHPDVVVGDCVLDIKTTGNFRKEKIADSSFLQCLAYLALGRMYRQMRYLGIILPMQKEIIIFDFTGWDHTRFFHLLLSQAQRLCSRAPIYFPPIEEFDLDAPSPMQSRSNHSLVQVSRGMAQSRFNIGSLPQEILAMIVANSSGLIRNPDGSVGVDIKSVPPELLQGVYEMMSAQSGRREVAIRPGSHIKKGKMLAESIYDFANMCPGAPIQVFITNSQSGHRAAKMETQWESIAAVIIALNLRFFIHSPYVINLCADEVDERGHWQQRLLNEELIAGVKLGAEGVVVHSGSAAGRSIGLAMDNMERMVREAIPFATEKTKLLIENMVGAADQVCSRPEELAAFFSRFSSEEKKRIALCLDTQHTWAAGFDPFRYLLWWERYVLDVPIALIHWNDSEVKCGAHVDRHAPIGSGTIGHDKLMAIAQWATERNIPLVRE